jgi:hypothetical protein
MAPAREIFGQNAVPWPQAMNRAIAESDLNCSRERNYVLTARCVVPIGKSAGLDPAEGDPTGSLCRRLLRDLARHERKRQLLEMRLTVTTTVKPKDWHWNLLLGETAYAELPYLAYRASSTTCDHELGPRTERGGASDQRAAHDQVIEQLTDHSQVLLGTRLSNVGAQLFQICSNGDGFNVLQTEAMSLAPIEEAFDRAQTIRVLRLIMLAVENSKKRAAGAFALGADHRRQPFEPGAHQRGQRYDIPGMWPRITVGWMVYPHVIFPVDISPDELMNRNR